MIVASLPSRRIAAFPIGTISSPSGTGPFARRYRYLCSKYTTGLSSRIAAFSRPFASYAVDGATTVAVAQRCRLVDDLIEPARDEIGELHLRHRPIAALRRTDADADDRRLGDRRIDDAHLAELLVEALRHAERTPVGADVLAEDEHLRIATHFFDERLANGFQIREVFAHTTFTSPQRTQWTQRFF